MPVKKSRRRSPVRSQAHRPRTLAQHPQIRATNEFLADNIHWFFKTLGCLLAVLTFLVALLALLKLTQ